MTPAQLDWINDVLELLEGQSDVRDGSDGLVPNQAMYLLQQAQALGFMCPLCELATATEELKANEGLCQPCRAARDERLKEAG